MRRNTLVWGLVFSLALNAAAMGSAALVWWKGSAQASETPSSTKPMKQYLREDLSLSKEQADELTGLIEKKRSAIDALKSRMVAKRMDLMTLVTSDDVTPERVNEKVQELDRIHGQIRRTAVDTLLRIAGSLSPDDRQKFGSYLKQRSCCPAPLGHGPGRGGPFSDFKSGR